MPNAAAPPHVAPPQLAQMALAPCVLIVEDEFLIRLMLAETLAEQGFHVIEAGNADEALALLDQHNTLALMITDLTLPGSLNGLALAQRVRALRADMPIIYVTGRPDCIDRDLLGPTDQVIGKPYLPSEVAHAARRACAMA